MEDTARVFLIQQVAAAFCASSGPQCRVTDPVDPHVLYAQHIYRQLKELRVPEHKQTVLERFEPAMREVLVRLVRVSTCIRTDSDFQPASSVAGVFAATNTVMHLILQLLQSC